MVWRILGRLAQRLAVTIVVALVSAVSIGWFSEAGINAWRDPQLLYNKGINLAQGIVKDDALMEDFVQWTGSPDLEVAWAQALLRSRGPGNAEAFAALERARAIAPQRADIVLVQAYARAADSDCNGLRLLRSYETMCRQGADCQKGGDPGEVTRALQWCRRPRPDEDPASAAQTVVGSLKACRDDYMSHSDAEALALCMAKAKDGDGAAAYDVGTLHFYGYGVARDYARGVTWFERGAELGDAESKAILGSTLYHGRLVEKDSSRGWKLMEEAAAAGSTNAMVSLGRLHRNGKAYGEEGQPDHEAARRWLTRAAEAGNGTAKTLLDRHYPSSTQTSAK